MLALILAFLPSSYDGIIVPSSYPGAVPLNFRPLGVSELHLNQGLAKSPARTRHPQPPPRRSLSENTRAPSWSERAAATLGGRSALHTAPKPRSHAPTLSSFSFLFLFFLDLLVCFFFLLPPPALLSSTLIGSCARARSRLFEFPRTTKDSKEHPKSNLRTRARGCDHSIGLDAPSCTCSLRQYNPRS